MSTAWMRRAACKGEDPELFFPASSDDDEGDRPMGLEQLRAARTVCQFCPVAMDCFEWAMANRKLTGYGVWGMTVPSQCDGIRGQRHARERESA